MTVKQVKGGWQADCQPGGRGGRRVRATFARKVEAEAWERQQMAGGKAVSSLGKLSDAIARWWEVHGHTLSSGPDTRNRLLAICRAMNDPKLSKFGAAHWSRYREVRLKADVKPGTLNRELCSMRAMFSELERLGEFSGPNPLLHVRVLRVPEADLRALSADEWAKVYSECRESRNPDLWLVALCCYLTGARWGEVERLRRSDVLSAAVRIRGESAKNGKVRVIPLESSVCELLLSHAKQERLFSGCYAGFRSAVKRAGVELPEGQLAHVLRHTFASEFLRRGGSLVELKTLLGHGSISVTSRYLHLVPGDSTVSAALPKAVDTWLTPKTKRA